MENYPKWIGVAAGSFMLKWSVIDEHLKNNTMIIQPGDNVNVFINFECILRNLSMQRGLGGVINFHKQRLVIELESSILNLMANYRMYFHRIGCNVKLYFYHTSLEKHPQQMAVYNQYYRNYYHNRYMENPQFSQMGKLLNDTIIPEIKLIISYIPGCYFIESKTFDSSIIPYAVSLLSDSKNVIFSGDVFDTLYMFNPNFIMVYINRRFQHFNVTSDIQSTTESIVKDVSAFDLTLFNSEMYYRLLLSIKGSKIRNIKSAKGFGYGKFISLMKSGLNDDIVLRDFESLDSIIQIFPENYREDIKCAFKCTSIENQYQLLSDTDIESIKSQIVDKSDIESLQALNNKRFLEYPISLQGLIN